MVDAGITVTWVSRRLAARRLPVQGKSLAAAERLLRDAEALERAGAFAILLEAVPAETAAFVRERVGVLVYGIGAGPEVDGQLVISHDLLGNFVGEIAPRFVKRYAEVGAAVERAFAEYARDVRGGVFPVRSTAMKSPRRTPRSLRGAPEPHPAVSLGTGRGGAMSATLAPSVATNPLRPRPQKCRACGAEHEAAPIAICEQCLGPLDPVLDPKRTLPTKAEIAARPNSLWRYREWLPFDGEPRCRSIPAVRRSLTAPPCRAPRRGAVSG
jgi:hypothetical protein